jgi:hypothetical protein
MRDTLTDGSIVIRNEHCRCGLTAGCANCQPVILRPFNRFDQGGVNVVVKPFRVIQHEWIKTFRQYVPFYVEGIRA